MTARIYIFCAFLCASLAGAQAKIAILDLQCDTAIAKPQDIRTLTGILAGEIRRYPGFEVMSASEVAGLLEHQAARQALGCTDEKCFAQIGGAIGADLLVAGSVGRIANKSMITVSLIDIVKVKAVRSVSRTMDGDPGQLIDALPMLVSELLDQKLAAGTKGAANVGTFADARDGQTYRWVRLGGVVWMAQDLNWRSLRLQTLDSALVACPVGWHLPGDEDWDALIRFADQKNDGEVNGNGGYSLKSKMGWDGGGRGSDLYGFKVLPTGLLDVSGKLWESGETGYFWSATTFDPEEARLRIFRGWDAYVDKTTKPKGWKAAIRCIQD